MKIKNKNNKMSQRENQITVAVVPGVVTESTVHWFQIDSHAARSVLSGFNFHAHFPFLFSDIFGGFYFIYGQINFFRRKRKTKSRKEKVFPPVFLSRCYPRTINSRDLRVGDRATPRHLTVDALPKNYYTLSIRRLLDGNKRGRRKVLWK